jgi:uncharacterized protein
MPAPNRRLEADGTMRASDEPRERARPSSPCVNICELDGAGFCIGCLRTGDEIGRWSAMSPAEQWRLIAELRARKLRAGQPV